MSKAQAEARAIIDEARAASDLALAELKEAQKRQDRLDWQQVNDSRAEARRLLNEAERNIGGSAPEIEAPPPTRPAVKGDTVELVKMGGTKAQVLAVNKDGGTIDALTGATVTSRAVTRAVNAALAYAGEVQK